ncbi:hypothetical protein NE237_017629 [Protea cynaroides]|uniref:Uncharacterized protein n=1 Tax=Protea cynaroides TaxID=273540 RepID=A0A9Q0K8F9_9MAGN|nr:hypothetical protein NE237_017629 [Protea cynaroides]
MFSHLSVTPLSTVYVSSSLVLSPPISPLVSSVLSPPISGWCWHMVCLFRSWKYRVALHTNRCRDRDKKLELNQDLISEIVKNRLDKDDKKLKLNLSWGQVIGDLKQDLVKVQTMFLRLMGRESRPPSLVKRKNPKPWLVVILVVSLASDSIYRVPSCLLSYWSSHLPATLSIKFLLVSFALRCGMAEAAVVYAGWREREGGAVQEGGERL